MNDREYYEQHGEMRHGYISGLPDNDNPHEQMESYQNLLTRKLEITEELEKCKTQRAMLEKENEYLMATLHDIRAGLDALHWHIQVANSTPEYYPGDPAFLKTWQAIKITQTELRNIIDEWESKWVLPGEEVPF
jgi:hypothetical protein